MFCTSCGKELSPYDRVCPSCGAPVSGDDFQEAAPSYEQPSYEQPVYGQNDYAQPSYEQPSYAQPSYDQSAYPQQNPYGQQPGYTYNNPVYPAQTAAGATSVTPTSVLVWGIAAIACACTFYFAFLGIIFGAIARGRSNNYLAAYGPISTKAKVGRILGTVGFILGIVFTVILFFVIIAVIADL